MRKRYVSHVFSAVLVYSILAGIGLLWMHSREQSILRLPTTPWLGGHQVGASIAAGLLLILVVGVGTRLLVSRVAWARGLHIEFRQVLGPLNSVQILMLAITSGVGEELFFRGALQPTVGFIFASILFGVLHVGPNKRFLPWTVWALVMGFVFGALYESTGCIEGSILAHVGINAVNLAYIDSYDPERAEKRSSGALVSGTKRTGGRLDT